jgi:tripartite-type tricarboxylate transporter receptor subunit TctC
VTKLPRRQFLHLAAGAAALASAVTLSISDVAWAQAARTIRIVVPLAPGGAASVVARLLADEISRTQGITTVVENRPGAGTVIGTEAVSRATPDGNTVVVTNISFLTNALMRRQNYDPLRSFEPICKLVDLPGFLAVNSASPYHTLADFVAAAGAKPGELTLAGFSEREAAVSFLEFERSANVKITYLAYPGSTPAVTALLGGHITSMMDNYATMAEHVNSGKLRVLATLFPRRVEGLEHIPTFVESGYNAYESWFGLFAPAKVPSATMSQLINWTTAAMRLPDVKRKLEPLGLYPTKMCGADFAALIRKQYEEFAHVIREAKNQGPVTRSTIP